MRVRIDLPGLPRGKGRGRAVSTPQGARVYTDAKTRSYEAALRYAAVQAMAGRAPAEEPVRFTLSVFFPVPESWSKRKRAQALAGAIWPTVKPDSDNALKLAADALNAICYHDDKQVVIATVFKCYSARPGISIEIDTLSANVHLTEPEGQRVA